MNSIVKPAEVAFVVRVFDRQHRYAVPHRAKSLDRSTADPLRGALGRNQLRIRPFQFLQSLHQSIEPAIADDRRILDIV